MSRILVDASAAYDQGAGIGRYSRNIISGLIAKLGDADWTVFHAPSPDRPQHLDWTPPEPVRHVTYPLSRRRMDQLAVRLGLPLPVRPFTGPQALVYSSDFTAPPFRGAPRIVTVHDIAFITHSHLTLPGMRAFHMKALSREVDRGAWIAAVSETTRYRLMAELGVDGERVVVVPNAVDRRFFDAAPLDRAACVELGLPDEFLLMVGTIEPRKNHETVLRVLEQRMDRGLPLVLVGRMGWGTAHLHPILSDLQANGRVQWLTDVADTQLPQLYATSRGVLYPSWTEGFGLPVLEALAAGKRVVSGNDPVFAEVAGGYATQVDPQDDRAVLEAIRMLEESPDCADDIQCRREHAARYSWHHSVDILVDFIRGLLREER